MFHGIDERVPVDGLRFGVRVLDRFLDLAVSAPLHAPEPDDPPCCGDEFRMCGLGV